MVKETFRNPYLDICLGYFRDKSTVNVKSPSVLNTKWKSHNQSFQKRLLHFDAQYTLRPFLERFLLPITYPDFSCDLVVLNYDSSHHIIGPGGSPCLDYSIHLMYFLSNNSS